MSFVLTSGIVWGTTYDFRIKAGNIYGYGQWSETKAIKAAGVPYQMLPVTTQLNTVNSVPDG
jgi:hypothetical protein